MTFSLSQLHLSGRNVLPLIEGGKGIGVSNGESAGAWAAAGGVGTFSAVNADTYDAQGVPIPFQYSGATRRQRHQELITQSIAGGITQAQKAYDIASGRGRIHMNILWEMGGAEEIAYGILEKTKGLVHGITCGAGMPYHLAQLADSFQVFYYPIISSARAFRALWRRSYAKYAKWLGGVVYEDPWIAGGHNGLSNSEDPCTPQKPYARVVELRKLLNEHQLHHVPIIMAGGVWWLSEWSSWFNNPEIGAIAFQFGSRPLLTQESPISNAWKRKLLTLKQGDVFLNRFSPTGFYSSAVRNAFLNNLIARSERQISFRLTLQDAHTETFEFGPRKRLLYVQKEDQKRIQCWLKDGYTEALKTPDDTIVFVTSQQADEIYTDQVNCMGCLSACQFSNWSQHAGSTGRKTDPRSFCIQKTLQDIAHEGDVEHNLMFAGQNVFRFAQDPFYANGFIPTVQQLMQQIQTGF